MRIHAVTAWFGNLALLAIIAAGFTLMFAPNAGWALLKNVAIAIALFVLGSILLQRLW